MTEKRKGAVRMADIEPSVLQQMNEGEIETASFPEWLAVDHWQLSRTVLPKLGMEKLLPDVHDALKNLKKPSTAKIIREIGKTLAPKVGVKSSKSSRFQKLARHRSDGVRCWACRILEFDSRLTFPQRLEASRQLAADSHWGVREVSWIALRDHVESHLEQAIKLLVPWTQDKDANVRRFAPESTRPRGVWSKHVQRLKDEPQLGLPILERLRSDESKYVRDSVANWLNDASKTKPDWVTSVCQRWEKESETPETKYVIKRAMRSLTG